jgi:hypothetical protein
MDSNTDRMSDGARRQATSRSLSSLDQSKTLFVTVTSQKREKYAGLDRVDLLRESVLVAF